MKGSTLPLKVKIENNYYWLDWDGSYFLKSENSEVIRFEYKISEHLSPHLRNWFRENKLPNPSQSRLLVVELSHNLFIPEQSLAIFLGYVEKYRKYLYPIIFNLEDRTYYLTSQPIYYNHDQSPTIVADSLVFQQIDGDSIKSSYNLTRIFSRNPPDFFYKVLREIEGDVETEQVETKQVETKQDDDKDYINSQVSS